MVFWILSNSMCVLECLGISTGNLFPLGQKIVSIRCWRRNNAFAPGIPALSCHAFTLSSSGPPSPSKLINSFAWRQRLYTCEWKPSSTAAQRPNLRPDLLPTSGWKFNPNSSARTSVSDLASEECISSKLIKCSGCVTVPSGLVCSLKSWRRLSVGLARWVWWKQMSWRIMGMSMILFVLVKWFVTHVATKSALSVLFHLCTSLTHAQLNRRLFVTWRTNQTNSHGVKIYQMSHDSVEFKK